MSNIFELAAKITLDSSQFESGIEKAKGETKGLGEHLKSGLSKVGKFAGIAVGAVATGVAAIGKSAVQSYASYEQLVGGVETLFKGSANVVQSYAKTAYKTAGMSANEYMETVTGFSASLIQSLGGDTAKAAEYANTAITDMSDNANKMGTDIGSIQYAYQGFAKQNYTMLDNLKIGYGGTRAEMQRLLDDANKINEQNGIHTEYQIDNYADIVDAIHVVQTEMGITGTTAEEADKTIEGSLSSMKSAWKNLLTGIADENADMDKLIGNFMKSAETAAKNLVPRIGIALKGIAEAFTKIVPEVISKLPEVLSIAIPEILNVVSEIINSISTGFLENAENLLEVGLQLITTLGEGVINGIPMFVERLPELINSLVTFFFENGPKILKVGVDLMNQIVLGIVKAIPELLKAVPIIISNFAIEFGKFVEQIWEIGVSILETIGLAVIETWNLLVEWFVGVWNEAITWWNEQWADIRKLWNEMWANIVKKIKEKWEAIKKWFLETWENIKKWVLETWEKVTKWFKEKWDEFVKKFKDAWNKLVQWWFEQWEALKQKIMQFVQKFVEVGRELVNKIKEGVANAWAAFTGWFDGLWSSFASKNRSMDVDVNIHENVTRTSSSGGYKGLPGSIDGSHANGLAYVPFDNYIAQLHKGERVLTAEENKLYNQGNAGITIIQHIQTVPQTAAEFAAVTESMFEEARWAF